MPLRIIIAESVLILPSHGILVAEYLELPMPHRPSFTEGLKIVLTPPNLPLPQGERHTPSWVKRGGGGVTQECPSCYETVNNSRKDGLCLEGG
jgi:hypothetical protein